MVGHNGRRASADARRDRWEWEREKGFVEEPREGDAMAAIAMAVVDVGEYV